MCSCVHYILEYCSLSDGQLDVFLHSPAMYTHTSLMGGGAIEDNVHCRYTYVRVCSILFVPLITNQLWYCTGTPDPYT